MIPQTSSHYTSRSILVVVLAALLVAPLGAVRTGLAAGEEWRPIEPADLALKAAVVEANADAEAIFWDIRVDDGGENDLVLSHYVRIKIFNEHGREKYSKIDIPYINGVKIKDVAARTIKSDGSIVELAKTDIIEKTVVKASGLKLRTKTFAFPGIEPGAIIEYKWKEVRSNSSANNLRLQFQRDIPVQSVTYHLKPAGSALVDVRPFNMDRPKFEKEKNGFQVTTVKNTAAFREEPMMPPEDSVRSWAMVRYQNLFTLLLGYNMLATQVYVGFQPYLKVDKEIKQKVAEITAGVDSAEDQIDKIFEFCRTNIKNTSDKSLGFTEDDIEKLKENKKPSDTLKRGVGPGIDINLLFAAMVNAAGFEARVALLPDRGERLFDRNVVVPGALRPSNIAVHFGTTWKFFDPGLQFMAPGMLRWQEEGVDALIVDENPLWVRTPVTDAQKSKEKRTAKLRLDENGTLEGDVTVEYNGHLAVERKVLNEDDSPAQQEENLKEMVKSRLSSAELTNIVIENAADPVKPFVYKYHVRVPEYAQRTGKRLFFQPGFFTKGISALFSAGTRQYPVYFHFPWAEEDKITIDLPKGYTLDNADRPAPINGGIYSQHEIKMGITKDEATLVYNRSFFFGNPDLLLFPVDRYDVIKQLFDEVNKADNHILALKQTGLAN
ncbi:MAG TPA: DUF3857 and transglutaminase domain-containing protein [Pyrinomonadaceae bacterium]|nr:DUF3857 and transglutaminase domain-containing protein [Pyrinomonadaceae bacterium]